MMMYLLLAILFSGDTAMGQTESLRFQGLTTEQINSLKTQMPQLFNAIPSQENVDDSIRAVMGFGSFERVSAQRLKSGTTEIIAIPLRIIDSVRITGNHEFSNSDLNELITLKAGERFDRKRVIAAGEKIKEYYSDHGFFNSIIEINFLKTNSGNLSIIFDIQEKNKCVIEYIEIQTSNSVLLKRLQRRLSKYLKKSYTANLLSDISKTMNDYLINNRYLATEVTGPTPSFDTDKTRAKIVFGIKNPVRYEFFIEGYEQLDLFSIYRILDFGNKERRNVDIASEGADRLKRAYISRGFPNASIDYKVIPFEQEYLNRIYYDIHEDRQVAIRKLEVTGRFSRPQKYYAQFILKNSSDLVAAGTYNKQDLENGYKNLITELRNQGYLKVRLQSSRVEYAENKKSVAITVSIDEGPLTQIRSVDFEGIRAFSSYELSQLTGLQPSTPLSLKKLEAAIEKLKAFYYRLGYLEMRLLNEGEDIIEYNEKGTYAHIKFRIYEGPRVRIARISVDGNTFTKSYVILFEADFKVGEILTPEKIEDATIRLNRMGLFSRVDIRTLEEGTNINDRTLIISVVERDPGLLRFGVGVNNERDLTARGFTGLSYNNLFGTARAVSGRVEVKSNIAEINYPEHEVTASYLEPFILNTRTRGRMNLTRSERVFEYQKLDEVTKITTSNRVDFLLERGLTRHTTFTWKLWSLDSRKEFERKGRCINPTVDLTRQCPPTLLQVAAIGPTLDIDYRDNPFLPTAGSFTRWILDYAAPAAGSTDTVEFVRTELSSTYYLNLGNSKLVWANSGRTGYLANLNERVGSGVPTSHAFFLGGIASVRGYDSSNNNERIPPNYELPIESSTQLVIRGESHYYLFKSELRFPLYEDHGGVIFYDAGMVTVSGVSFSRPLRQAVGVGYRYNTAVGPVSFDIGFKIDPRSDQDREEKPLRIHFSIGTF